MSGAQGSYTGFVDLDENPCAWGVWKGKSRMIIGYWGSEEEGANGLEMINGTLMDIQPDKFFFGCCFKGEYEDCCLVREIREGKPVHLEGSYRSGKLSGNWLAFEILDNGKPGESLYEEIYVRGEKTSRKELGNNNQ